jgi:hypothetical protein
MEHTQTEIHLAHKIHRQNEEIEELKGMILILQSKIQIERGKNIELKSIIGHQNIHIQNLEDQNTIDI